MRYRVNTTQHLKNHINNYGHAFTTGYDKKHCLECKRIQSLDYYRRNTKLCNQRNNASRVKRVREGFNLIMKAHGVYGCMYKIHPYMPEELKKRKCWGKLTIEHPNGGGRAEIKKNGPNPSWRVVIGLNKPTDFMLLCTLHQIWNYGRFGLAYD